MRGPRDLLLVIAVWIAGVSQLASGCLYGAVWLGGLAWFILSGNIFWVAVWILLSPLLLSVAISLLRLPFILLGLLIAALAGRQEEYFDYVASLSNR